MNPSTPTLAPDPRFRPGHRPYRGVGGYDTDARRAALTEALTGAADALELARAADPDAPQAFATVPGAWTGERARARRPLREALETLAVEAVERIEGTDGMRPSDALRELIKHGTSEAARTQRGMSTQWMQDIQATVGQILSNPFGASGSSLRLAAAHCRALVELMNDPAGYPGARS
jgi:hypothetical protein